MPARRNRCTGTRGSSADQAASASTDRKSTRLNSSHPVISYAVFCLKKKNAIGKQVVEVDLLLAELGHFLDICTGGEGLFRTGQYFFFNDTATTEIYTLSLHDALPI